MAALVIHLMASITNVSASQVSEVLSVKRVSLRKPVFFVSWSWFKLALFLFLLTIEVYPYASPCYSQPCFNGGECHEFESSFKCKCAKGFHGVYCEAGKLKLLFLLKVIHPILTGSARMIIWILSESNLWKWLIFLFSINRDTL